MDNTFLISGLVLCAVAIIAVLRGKQSKADPVGHRETNRAMFVALIAFCLPLSAFVTWRLLGGGDAEEAAAIGFVFWMFVLPGALVLAVVTFLVFHIGSASDVHQGKVPK